MNNIYDFELNYLDEAECEMNCKPIGMNYFATLGDRVIDGTSCLFPIDFVRQNHTGRAMCVDGVCKVRHTNFYQCYMISVIFFVILLFNSTHRENRSENLNFIVDLSNQNQI